MWKHLQATDCIDSKPYQYEVETPQIDKMECLQTLAAEDERFRQNLAIYPRDHNCLDGTHRMPVVEELRIQWGLYQRAQERVRIFEAREGATHLRNLDSVLLACGHE